MKVSNSEEYGLRCLLQLAGNGERKILTAADIGRAEGLSLPYVAKLLNILKHASLVESVRGVHGGYRLSRSPGEISLADVAMVFNENGFFHSHFCEGFTGQGAECVHYKDSCSIRSVWSVVGEQIQKVFRNITLLDLAVKQEPLMAAQMREKFSKQPTTAALFDK